MHATSVQVMSRASLDAFQLFVSSFCHNFSDQLQVVLDDLGKFSQEVPKEAWSPSYEVRPSTIISGTWTLGYGCGHNIR